MDDQRAMVLVCPNLCLFRVIVFLARKRFLRRDKIAFARIKAGKIVEDIVYRAVISIALVEQNHSISCSRTNWLRLERI